MTKKRQMTAGEILGEARGILECYMNNEWSGYRNLLSISRGEGGVFNNDWEAEAFYACQALIELLGLDEPQAESEDDVEDDNDEVQGYFH